MAFVSITRLRVRSWWLMPAFGLMAARTARQAVRASGNLHARVLRERGRTFWTSTSWESDAAMRGFMLAEPHKTAMRKLLEWCDEASLVHWAQESEELPTWKEAHARMVREGRPSKVNHPSEAQKAFAIPEPPEGGRGDVRFK